ncbi:tetratricopeptide repeat protein [Rhodopirellula sp. MGV]|uniref:tetratricopeptide repeat protein n=1 Tax=Rhodopirellula sp. MGV TaxID=2023130 RepID=UPI000B966AD1|nr:hypothetical protein [Rhodopirellula sp. MGV]OYP37203.1 hypothetical protein CGZ80_05800 [Rhodopirellula sp. MGV]PNY37980.1 hypothetical protein C2E31_05650 [Rhodopirellula baltica]
MIIYGSRMYFQKNAVQSYGECGHCGRYAKQKSYQARKFGHIYFIPLIPAGPTSQVLNECSACNMGSHIPLDQCGPMVESLRENFKDWIIKIQDGETEVVPEPGASPVNIGVMIAGTVESLFCLGEIKDVDSIVEILDGSGLEFEKYIVLGRWNELRGDLPAAVTHYRSAAQKRPDDGVGWYQTAKAESLRSNAAGAEEAYNRYLQLHPDDIGVVAELANLYEAHKNHPKVVESYDRLYAMNSDLLANKQMKKVYKKACKKSQVEGQFLKQM